ncbi:MAG: Nif3-like dinuclear metal center hexameric protein [Phycisphaerae bacterium]|nr:Nif3-like dinuclear metal center hexameric protein [Phycisphaerae bacterium]
MASRSKRYGIGAVVRALDAIADPALAQDWDNVGLIAGDRGVSCRGAMLCIDMTAEVLDEATAAGANLIVAYHPPIFRPITRLSADSAETDALVLRALYQKMHIYSPHTALDAADGGTNDVIAGLCGIDATAPFEDVPAEPRQVKVVVFVPPDEVETVAEAMFSAGAGRIGEYERCSYRLAGTGTFFGTEGTDPSVGERGRLERVEEIRLEAVAPRQAVAGVLGAVRRVHSYEEPAMDVYPLDASRMRAGIGRIGSLPGGTTLSRLAKRLKKAVGAPRVQVIGVAGQRVHRAAICVGSAGRLPAGTPRARDCDVIVTGEVSHHDALYWRRRRTVEGGAVGVIALGHWYSERPVLACLAERMREALPGLGISVSRKDRDPFTIV